MFLCGEFRHAVDAKNRLFIPAKHREDFGDEVIIVRDSECPCLLIYSIDEWASTRAAAIEKIPESRRHRTNRYIYRNALKCGFDSQGRILLSPELCAYAGLAKGTAVIVGCGSYSEIWNEENYEAELACENSDEIVETFRSYES